MCEINEGGWDAQEIKDLQDAVERLFAEEVYEDGRKESGISVKFIQRMQALKYYSETGDLSEPLIAEAKKNLGDSF